MVPLFSHIMNIGSAQWGQIILYGVFLFTSFFTKDIGISSMTRLVKKQMHKKKLQI